MDIWNEIFKILLAVLAVILTRYVVPAIRAYLDEKNESELYALVADLVAAAEKLFPGEKTGSDKLEYVVDRLENMGVTYTDAVRAKIEAAVYRLEG